MAEYGKQVSGSGKFYLPEWLQDRGSEQGVNQQLSVWYFLPGAFLGLMGGGGKHGDG